MMKSITTFLFCTLFFTATRLSAQVTIFTDAYAAGVTFVDFGSSTNAVTIDNTTFQSGTSSIKIAVPATGYTGGAFVAATNQNLSAYDAISFWIKGSAAKKLNVAGLGNSAATTVFQTELADIPVTTTWTKIIIPIPDASKLTAEKGLFHFAEGSDEGAYTIWLDNIQYEILGSIGMPTATIATETINKGIGDTFGPTGLTCTFSVNSVATKLTPSAAYFTYTSSAPTVATINAVGVGTTLAAGTTNITAKLRAINATGTLTVNVAAAAAPTVAAPTPTRSAANVISLFSNAYTDLAGTDWFPNWGQTTVVSDVQIATNATKKYTNFNYQGVQFAAPVNVSAMTYLHIDVWTPNMTSFKVFLINIPPLTQKEQEVVLTPTLSGWNSFDIPLSSYNTLVMTGIGQLKLESVPSGTAAYLDNIYFHKDAVVAPAPTMAAPTPTRPAADVISLYSKPYTNVAAIDWFPNWGQTTVVSDVLIAGDSTKKYATMNYQGVQLASDLNVSAMNFLHIDMWTSSITSFKVSLINTNPATVEQAVTLTPTLLGWNSFDIPLTSYNLIALAKIGQLKLEAIPTGGTAYLDNIYFYKAVVAPTAPTVAAPTPTRPASSVISLYSKPYTSVAGVDWFPNWGQTTVVSDVLIATDSTKKYTNFNYQGVQFATDLNVSTMNYLHIDLWTPNMTAFKVFLINTSPATVEQAVTLTPTLSGWNSFNIPLASFNTINMTKIGQFKFESVPFGSGTAYMDNIYFFKTGVGTKDVAFANDLFTATPSVSDEFFSLNLTEKVKGATQITLTNLLGQNVYQQTLSADGTTQSTLISTKNLADGLYIVGVRVGATVQTQKVTVSH